MGASASGNAYAEMINNGYDKGQANAYAALTGLSETTLQYLLGGISSLGGLTDDVLSGAIDNVVRGMNRANLQIAAKYGKSESLQSPVTGKREILKALKL